MARGPIAGLMGELLIELQDLFSFFFSSKFAQNGHLATANDFVFGNPHEMPLEEIGRALAAATEPQNESWYAYKLSEDEPREVIAETLRESHGLAFTPSDLHMTNGAFGGIALALRALIDPGDEVVYQLPPWFFYHPMIRSVGGVPVPVMVREDDWDLDLEAIEAAITERTRMVIVNTPNNPTGRIYPAETLASLGEILRAASVRNGRPVYLLSDESYNRIVYEPHVFESPLRHYERSLLVYTYGKTLLAPGLRIGYLALPPGAPDGDAIRGALMMAATTNGWAFPVSLLQQALPDLEKLSIDLGALQKKRDRMVTALRDAGYEVHEPEGTFYLLPKCPGEEDEFIDRLADQEVYVLPGKLIDLPGTFRISLTANDEMIDRALPVFTAAGRP
jgi:aspartate aminotransferase